jgi:amino acid adenylation domain-containing protein
MPTEGDAVTGVADTPVVLEFPLSFPQLRLWFLNELEPGLLAYNLPVRLRLRGPLDVGALERALNDLAERHEALRTAFVRGRTEPLQRVLPPRFVPLREIDLSRRASGGLRELDTLVADDVATPFDLERGRLFRATLYRVAADDHVLLLVLHHIVFDGWSISLLLSELSELYRAMTSGAGAELPELPIQYGDFAAWQREQADGHADGLAYWRTTLAGAPPETTLIPDRPRAQQQAAGGRVQIEIDRATVDRAAAVAGRERATLFMVLLAAFATLLRRHTSQDDVVIGTPTAGRPRLELEPLIGCFANTVVLRTDVGGNPSFRELVGRVRAVALGAFEHEEIPFERIVEELRPSRTLGRNPIFQVMMSFATGPEADLDFGGLAAELEDVPIAAAQFDLTLELAPTSTGNLVAAVEYDRGLFEAETAAGVADQFVTLLDAATRDPDLRVSALPVLPGGDLARLDRWNDTGGEYPGAGGVEELVEAHAAQAGDRCAVVCGGRELSFGELDGRANALALELVARGVGPDVPVGVCLERSEKVLVALLGVLKTGGAFVPLDPTYPAERLEYMVRDSGATIVVTEPGVDVAPPGVEALELGECAATAAVGPPRTAGPDQLAYTIYTSGSTGRPKGVAVSRRALANLVEAIGRELELGRDEAWLAVTSLSFDISILELLLPLTRGSRVVVAEAADVVDGHRLVQLVRRTGVTIMQATPSTWRLLLAAGWEGGIRAVCGGEALPPDLARELLARADAVWNVYGPTETTIWSTCVRLSPDGPVTIGRPLLNTRTYVVDEHFALVPIGAAGELLIGGDGLARGYVGRPGQTAAAFVPDPFSESGGRLYRTGDLVRRRRDGELEFRGRIDNQVKVRGFRIELGEIESVLEEHPTVRQAVVVVREHGGSADLAAFVLGADGPPDPAPLQSLLRSRLPGYMLPASIVPIEQWPQTPNGKIDREALRALEPESVAQPAAPTTAEEAVAAIWRQVLGIAEVGSDIGFFELGGHSLQAMELVARLRQELGVTLGVREVFASPTVREQAAFVGARGGRTPAPAPEGVVEASTPVRRDVVLPLLPNQRARLSWDEWTDAHGPVEPPFVVDRTFRIRGPLDVAALGRAIDAVVQRHEALRATFPTLEGRRVQLVRAEPAPSLAVVDVSTSPAPLAAGIEGARAARAAPFDLDAGPVLRATLVRLGDDDHVLSLVTPHLISDGWSMAIVLGDIAAAYAALASGEDVSLPPPRTSYGTYVRELTDWLASDEATSQTQQWERRLGRCGPCPQIELPFEHAADPSAFLPNATTARVVDDWRVGELRSMAAENHASLFAAGLAAFAVLLHAHSRYEAVGVLSPLANRMLQGSEDVVGWVGNPVILPTTVRDEMSFAEVLASASDAVLSALDLQRLPYMELVRRLQPEYFDRPPPKGTISIVHIDEWMAQPFRLQRVKVEPLEIGASYSQTRLSLALIEEPEQLVAAFTYDVNRLPSAAVDGFADDYVALLGRAARDPQTRVADLVADVAARAAVE